MPSRGDRIHAAVIRNGEATFVYDDRFLPVHQQGEARISRASHVEPAPGGGWIADMTPSGGPILWAEVAEQQHVGFATRELALAAERAWLTEHLGI